MPHEFLQFGYLSEAKLCGLSPVAVASNCSPNSYIDHTPTLDIPGEYGLSKEFYLRIYIDEEIPESLRAKAKFTTFDMHLMISANTLSIIVDSSPNKWESIFQLNDIPNGKYCVDILNQIDCGESDYQRAVLDHLSWFDRWSRHTLTTWLAYMAGVPWLLVSGMSFVIFILANRDRLRTLILYLIPAVIAWYLLTIMAAGAIEWIWSRIPWFNRWRNLDDQFHRECPELVISLRSVAQGSL